jgi:hypothetical protein
MLGNRVSVAPWIFLIGLMMHSCGFCSVPDAGLLLRLLRTEGDILTTIPRFTAENREANQALVDLLHRVAADKGHGGRDGPRNCPAGAAS